MITIIMAAYNGQEYINEQLESIENQTYRDWRLVVRDDGSSDKTVDILKKFAKEVEQEVIIKVNEEPSGSAKRNFARLLQDVQNSSYVMFTDQDDIWKKDKIEVTYNAMLDAEKKYGSKTPILVHGDVEVIDGSGNVLAESMFNLSHIDSNSELSKIIIQNHVTGCTMMCNRSLSAGIAKYLSDDRVIMHDYFAALYAAVFGKIIVLERPLLSYRQHGDNSVGAKNNNNIFYLAKRLGQGRRSYKNAMKESEDQIAFFVSLYKDEMIAKKFVRQYELMKEYSVLNRHSKIYRIIFYMKKNVWKKGTIRKIMQIIWG